MIQAQAPMNKLYIGIMSGTSVDAIDVVAIEIEDKHFSFVGGINFELPDHLRTKILEITRKKEEQDSKIIAELDNELGFEYANAVNQLLRTYKIKKEKVAAIGLHGQTIAHYPNAKVPRSIQIGDAKLVAQKTEIICVADFRSADINAGGQGAPLAPVFHSWLFRIPNKNRAIINIGGISNISILDENPLRGHDLGPGNILLDSWIQSHEKEKYDHQGLWARQGNANENLLDIFLEDDFFSIAPPKSTGADYFNLDWIETNLNIFKQNIAPKDVQSTLTEVTARIISDCLNTYTNIAEAAICGGGSENTYLVERIMKLYKGKIFRTDDWGLKSKWVEASGFAYLAYLRLKNQDLELSGVTGSTKKVRLGEIHTP